MLLVGVEQEVARHHVLELGDGPDVALAELVRRLVLLALQRKERADPFLVVRPRVGERRVRRDRALEDAEDVDAAGERIGDGLEDEGSACRVLDLDRRALLRRGRHALDQQVEHGRRAEVLRRDSARDREELAARDCGLQRRGDLFRRQLLAVEIALHERLVRLDDRVEELRPVLLDLVRHLRGNLAGLPSLTPSGLV